MADVKISALPSASSVASGDLIPVIQGGVTKQATVSLLPSGGGTPGGSTTQVQYNNASAFGGITGATADGTTMTLTSPKIVTSIKDTNANTLLGVTATGSAVNNFTIANSATSTLGGTIGVQGTGTNLDINMTTKGDGAFRFGSNPPTTHRNSIYFDNTEATSRSSQFTFAKGATQYWSFGNDSGTNGTQDFFIYDNVAGLARIYFNGTRAELHTDSIFGWPGSLAFPPAALDTALSRNTAGVVEVNNGTAGQYRDIKARNIDVSTAYTVAGITTAADYANSSISSVSAGYAADTYLAGSNTVVTAGGFKAKGQYHCVFDMVKTGAGTATPIITVRIGTAGTTADTARLTFTFGAGTGVIDTGTFDLWVNFRTVGAGTSAVVQGICIGRHNLATTGLFNNADVWTIVGTPSAGFDSSAATTIGVSFNGGTSFSGTNTVVQATLNQ
jgi:hypothetical protein